MKILLSIWIVIVMLSLFVNPVSSNEFFFKKGVHNVEDVVNQLTPPAEETKKFKTRGSFKPRSISLAIHFGVNSHDLTAEAMETLDYLGQALNDDGLMKFSFLLEGHTDVRGSAEYNLDLSNKRADAVKEYLVMKHGVDAGRLFTEGKGETELADKQNPKSVKNRRVRIINAGTIN